MQNLQQLPQKVAIPQHLRRQEQGRAGGARCSVNRDCPKGHRCKPSGHGCCNHAPKRCFKN